MEHFEETGPEAFSLTTAIKLGRISGSVMGDVRLRDLRPMQGYRMEVSGSGSIGELSGTGVLELVPAIDRTRVSYQADAEITGGIASVGQRLLGMSAKLVINQFLRCMNGKLIGAGSGGADGDG